MDKRDILARLKEAKAPDRELDEGIILALNPKAEITRYPAYSNYCPDPVLRGFFRVPDFTASADAALTLVEKVLPGWKWCCGSHLRPWAALYAEEWERTPDPKYASGCHEGKTPPLAILTALFETLIAQEAEVGKR